MAGSMQQGVFPYSGMSHPYEPYDGDSISSDVVLRVQALLEVFEYRYLPDLVESPSVLRGKIIKVSERMTSLSDTRHPVYGLLHYGLISSNRSALLKALVGIVLSTPPEEELGSWSIDCLDNVRFTFCDRILPAARVYQLSTEGSLVRLSGSGGFCWSLSLREMENADAFPPDFLEVAKVTPSGVHPSNRTLTLWDAAGLSAFMPLVDPFELVDGLSWEVKCAWERALALLEKGASEFLDWALLVTKGVGVLTMHSGGDFASSSSKFTPGLILVSAATDDIELAESLVHESAHQHAAILEATCEFSFDSEPKYFSLPVNAYRPLSRILIAFHAFANITLMYFAFLESGSIGKSEFETRVAYSRKMTRSLDAILARTTDLSVTGAMLYEPLAEELRLRGEISR